MKRYTKYYPHLFQNQSKHIPESVKPTNREHNVYGISTSFMRRGFAQLMPINIIKTWCRNDSFILHQPLSNDCLVKIMIINFGR